MIAKDQIPTLLEHGTVVGDDGSKIGKIEQIYVDDDSGRPAWVTVKTGMFGGPTSFVPLTQADADGSQLRVPYDKKTIKDAPQVESDERLSLQEEQKLSRHYQTGGDSGGHHHPRTERSGSPDAIGGDTSAPSADDAMTRSEERLHVGTETRESGRARLRKYVVTENVTQTVPVSHEEVRVEREPITDANRDQAKAGGEIADEEHEVTLHEEVPVVRKETVPVERVRMDTETVTGEEQVSEQVRKEQIEADEGRGKPAERGRE